MNGLDNNEFMDELILNATHEGTTYKNADAAIDLQFELFQKRRREEEAETFQTLRGEMVMRMNAYWAKQKKESAMFIQNCTKEDCGRVGYARYSLGIYAGRYCDEHWKESGYRDEPASAFDPADAGETYGDDDL